MHLKFSPFQLPILSGISQEPSDSRLKSDESKTKFKNQLKSPRSLQCSDGTLATDPCRVCQLGTSILYGPGGYA